MTVEGASPSTAIPVVLRLATHVWERLGGTSSSPTAAAKGREVPGTLIIAALGAIVGIVATIVFWRAGWLLLYSDAQSHLVIARRVVDSQNSGFQQLGTVWLPMPHILLLLFVQNFAMWQSGLSGALLGTVCLSVSAGALWRIAFRVGFNRAQRLVTVAVFLLNASILYLSTTALTEPVLIATLLCAIAGLSGWITAMPAVSPGELAVFAGLPTAAAVLSRYEGWAFVAVGSVFVIIASWRRWRSMSYTLILVFSFVAAPVVAIMWWLVYNYVRYGDPLDFARGQYSAAVQQSELADLGLLPTKGNLGLAVRTFNWSVGDVVGPAVLIIAAVGVFGMLWMRATSTTALILWMPAFIYPFALLGLYVGQTAIRNDASLPTGTFNIRFAAGLVPFVALMVGAAVGLAFHRGRGAGLAAAWLAFAVVVGSAAWSLSDAQPRMGVVREGFVNSAGRTDASDAARWLGDHYEGGYILIDDVSSNTLMSLGLPLDQLYASFNGDAYEEALADPYKFVDYVFADTASEGDRVWQAISKDPNFGSRFYPVYEAGNYTVWQNTRRLGPIS